MHSIVIVKMECERDESWFISVAPTERFFLPTCNKGARKQREHGLVQLFNGVLLAALMPMAIRIPIKIV